MHQGKAQQALYCRAGPEQTLHQHNSRGHPQQLLSEAHRTANSHAHSATSSHWQQPKPSTPQTSSGGFQEGSLKKPQARVGLGPLQGGRQVLSDKGTTSGAAAFAVDASDSDTASTCVPVSLGSTSMHSLAMKSLLEQI
ncbi:hypothetical protein ABBQ38_001749 [Trebouxia sp. C0009 RCD-2024]